MEWLYLGAGLVMGWCARIPEARTWRDRWAHADTERQDATNRLLAAWKDGYSIPEPEADVVPVEPLPAALQDIVLSYEDPTAQAKIEAAIRRKLNAGRTVDAIVMDAEVGTL